jgi:hypothetical protein
MTWRAAVVAAYVVLAVVVGVAYGGDGLVVLSYFYVYAGAWAVFLIAWGWATRTAGRWSFRRRDAGEPHRPVST